MTSEHRVIASPSRPVSRRAKSAPPAPRRNPGDAAAPVRGSPRRGTDWVVRVLRHSGAPIYLTRPVAALVTRAVSTSRRHALLSWVALFALQLGAAAGAALGWAWCGEPTVALASSAEGITISARRISHAAAAPTVLPAAASQRHNVDASLQPKPEPTPRSAAATTAVAATATADTDSAAGGSETNPNEAAGAADSSAAGASNELDENAIVAGVKAQVSAVLPCLRTAVHRGELQRGTPYRLVLDWTIEPDGTTTATHVEAPAAIASTAVPTCMASAMHNWRFPASEHGALVHNYPFGPFTLR